MYYICEMYYNSVFREGLKGRFFPFQGGNLTTPLPKSSEIVMGFPSCSAEGTAIPLKNEGEIGIFT
jgi:hypothetical protein